MPSSHCGESRRTARKAIRGRGSTLHAPYDRALMKRCEVARRLIAEGEDASRVVAVVGWPAAAAF
jgi:hypothetical protein